MKTLMPGVWIDDSGALHLDVATMLRANGYADTPENRSTLIDAAVDIVRRENPRCIVHHSRTDEE